MLDQRIRKAWEVVMRPVAGAVGRSGLTPNTVTVLGVATQIVAAVMILRGRFLVAACVAAVAALLDSLDGVLARARGMSSRFGALLDSTTDRLSDALLFLPLAWLYGVEGAATTDREPWVAGVALGAMVLSFLVSYVKARAEGLGFECNVGIAERAERVIITLLGLAFDVVPIALVVLGVLSVITLLQRVLHVRAQGASAS